MDVPVVLEKRVQEYQARDAGEVHGLLLLTATLYVDEPLELPGQGPDRGRQVDRQHLAGRGLFRDMALPLGHRVTVLGAKKKGEPKLAPSSARKGFEAQALKQEALEMVPHYRPQVVKDSLVFARTLAEVTLAHEVLELADLAP